MEKQVQELTLLITELRKELQEIRRENAELKAKILLQTTYGAESPSPQFSDDELNSETNEWRQTPKRLRKTQRQTENKITQARNHFAILEDEEMEITPPQTQTETETNLRPLGSQRRNRLEFPPMPTKTVPLTEALKPQVIPRIPPIKVKNTESFPAIEKLARERSIKIKFAKHTNQALQIHLETAEDHRKLTAGLKEHNQQYFSYTLPEDKLLRVVIRGIPAHETETSIKDQLRDKGFEVIEVTQLYKRIDGVKHNFPMMLVKLPRSEASKEIYNLKFLGHFKISVETQKTKHSYKQCFRCQQFGHTQGTCQLNPKCVKCSGEHWSYECEKLKTTPAVCANCGLSHPANYRGCKNYPGNSKKEKTQPRKFESNKVVEGISHTDKVAPKLKPTHNKEPSMTKMLAQVTSLLTKIVSRHAKNSQLSLDNKLRLYKVVIIPSILYCSTAWGQAEKCHKKKLEILQNRILRKITDAPWFIRNTDIRQDLNMDTISKQIKLRNRKLLDKLEFHSNKTLEDALSYDPQDPSKIKRPKLALLENGEEHSLLQLKPCTVRAATMSDRPSSIGDCDLVTRNASGRSEFKILG